jgi:transposase
MKKLTYFEIPDELWKRVEPLFDHFKRKKSGGIAPVPFRTLLAGMLYKLKTGCQWSMIPKQYGSKSTLHEHYQRWINAGIFAEILSIIAVEFHEKIGFEFEWQSMDGTLIQAPVRKKNLKPKALEQTQQIEGVVAVKSICTQTPRGCPSAFKL